MSLVKLAKSFIEDKPSKVTGALIGSSIGGMILSGIKGYNKNSKDFRKFVTPLAIALGIGAGINHKMEKK